MTDLSILRGAPWTRASLSLLLATTILGGCSGQLDHLGRPPTMSPVAETRNSIDPSLPARPQAYPQGPHNFRTRAYGGAYGGAYQGGYETASIPATPSSLWNSGPTSLFGDRRAKTIGDILTVVIDIDDSAEVNNSTTRSRSGSDSVSVGAAFGLDELVNRVIPGDAVSLEKGVDASGTSSSAGNGAVTRDESISLKIAATVVDVLPNGHLVVTGSQEVRVNFELRDLQVAGVIRPEDISRQNTITYEKMANARISYGGRGQISDLQQPRLGQQVIDLVSPF